jgi:hypothetical protein
MSLQRVHRTDRHLAIGLRTIGTVFVLSAIILAGALYLSKFVAIDASSVRFSPGSSSAQRAQGVGAATYDAAKAAAAAGELGAAAGVGATDPSSSPTPIQ